MKFKTKIGPRPLIQLKSVWFLSISPFPSPSLSLSLYEIHIKGWTETPYSITIRPIFKHLSLSLWYWFTSNQRLERDPLFDYNPSRYWILLTRFIFNQRLERDPLFNYNPSDFFASLAFPPSLSLTLSLTLWNSHQRLDRDPLFDYNPSRYWHFWTWEKLKG